MTVQLSDFEFIRLRQRHSLAVETTQRRFGTPNAVFQLVRMMEGLAKDAEFQKLLADMHSFSEMTSRSIAVGVDL